MSHLYKARAATYAAVASLGHRSPRRARRNERGDVPGWVLITLMTAALALLVWGLASDRLETLFTETFDGFGFGE